MNRQRGLGKFEFAVVLAIFGILATLLLNRLIAIEHETEQLAVALTIRHIHVGLKLAIGEKIMRGREAEMAALLDENPLNFLGDSKANVGDGKTAGQWTYQTAGRILIYRPRQPEAFEGLNALRWHYVAHTDNLGRTVGLRLEPLK